ncbi:hypothetical protein HYFRA_00009308 [Hymenoscyphus fraxineus]|uniref:Uncharacterized protein n=1 Tax=Hymenoscyphus fraxineus TaxID=746836 RepID=A0A9N9L3X1_9HELO|nr:hypothetical protein HYFRA_00009308 [Hymenoscyphus fraxineus]
MALKSLNLRGFLSVHGIWRPCWENCSWINASIVQNFSKTTVIRESSNLSDSAVLPSPSPTVPNYWGTHAKLYGHDLGKLRFEDRAGENASIFLQMIRAQ